MVACWLKHQPVELDITGSTPVQGSSGKQLTIFTLPIHLCLVLGLHVLVHDEFSVHLLGL